MAKSSGEGFPHWHLSLIALRERQGLSSAELARRAGMSRAYLCDIEAGRQPNPSVGVVKQLADALGVGLADVLGDGGLARLVRCPSCSGLGWVAGDRG